MDDQALTMMLKGFKETLDKVEDKVDGLVEEFAKLDVTCPLHLRSTRNLQFVVFGNPEDEQSPGLVKRVDRIEGWVKVVNWGLKALWAVVGALSVAVLTKVLVA